MLAAPPSAQAKPLPPPLSMAQILMAELEGGGASLQAYHPGPAALDSLIGGSSWVPPPLPAP